MQRWQGSEAVKCKTTDFESLQRCNCGACYAFKLHLSEKASQESAPVFMTEEEEEEVDYVDTLEPDKDDNYDENQDDVEDILTANDISYHYSDTMEDF